MKYIRRILLGLLLVWPHLLTVVGGISEELSLVYIISIPIVLLISIINALLYKSDNTAEELAFGALIIKVAHIPFYVTIFLTGVVLLPASLFTIMAVFAWAIYLVLFIIDYIFLLSSSAYTIKSIWIAKKQGLIHVAVAIALTIFSFVFVTDVICAILNCIVIRINKIKNIEKSC